MVYTFMAFMAYSTWNILPSGEKVLTPLSYSLLSSNIVTINYRRPAELQLDSEMEYKRAFKMNPEVENGLNQMREIIEAGQNARIGGQNDFIAMSKNSQRKIDGVFALLNRVIEPQLKSNNHETTSTEMKEHLQRALKPMVYKFNDCVQLARSQDDSEECGERLYTELMNQGLQRAMKIASDY